MLARLNRARHSEQRHTPESCGTRPKLNYFTAHAEEENPFSEASLIDPIDSAQHEDIYSVMEKMKQSAYQNGLP